MTPPRTLPVVTATLTLAGLLAVVDADAQPLTVGPALELDPEVILRVTGSVDDRVAAASDGTSLMGAWLDDAGGTRTVRIARVDADGDPIGGAGAVTLAITNHQAAFDGVGILYDGGGYLVSWTGAPVVIAGTLRIARVSTTGQLLAGPVSVSGDVVQSTGGTAVAFDGTGYVVVWQGVGNGAQRSIKIRRYALDLSPVDVAPLSGAATGITPGDPVVSCLGSTCLIAWAQLLFAGGEGPVLGARYDAATGTLLDTAPIELSGAAAGATPAVSHDGTRWLVAWSTSTGVRGVRVDAMGAIVDAASVALGDVGSGAQFPGLVFDGARYQLARRESGGGIRAYAIDPATLSADEGRNLTPPETVLGTRPAIAAVGGSVFVGGYTAQYNLYGGIASTTGAFGAAFPMNRAPNSQTMCGVATGPDGGVALWLDTRDAVATVWAAHFDVGGTVDVLQPLSGTPPRGVLDCVVTADGTGGYFAAWAESVTPTSTQLYGAFLDDALDMGDGPLLLSSATFAGVRAVACIPEVGCGLVYAWTNFSTYQAFFTRVSADGALITTDTLGATSNLYSAGYSLAASDVGYHATWADGSALYGAQAAQTGNVGATYPIVVQSATSLATAASDGTDFLVAWKDVFETRIRAARIDDEGTIVDAEPFVLTTASAVAPAASFADGHYFVGWRTATTYPVAEISPTAGLLTPVGGEVWLDDIFGANPLFLASADGVEHVVAYSADPGPPIDDVRAYLRLAGPYGSELDAGAVSLDGGELDGGGFDGGGGPDGGGLVDAGLVDAGPVDAGLVDAGLGEDGGEGVVDAGGAFDAGAPADGGPADGGPADGGAMIVDGGAETDGGLLADAGTLTDAGSSFDDAGLPFHDAGEGPAVDGGGMPSGDGGANPAVGGCTCGASASSDAGAATALMVLALVGVAGRRARRRSVSS